MPDRNYVCNASPLILLARINHLGLLADLADAVRVPESVLREVDEGSARDGAGEAVRETGRLQVVPDVAVPDEIGRWQLGSGETQVLAVALRTSGAEVVLDDLAARRCAKSLGIPVIGTIGIVALSSRIGLVPAAAPLLDDLRESGLWLSDALVAGLLRELEA